MPNPLCSCSGPFLLCLHNQRLTPRICFPSQMLQNGVLGPNMMSSSAQPEKKKPHIKKPLNAFMLFMKAKRAEVMKECTLKESAAINQILGKKVR